ncbi:MAG: hypothetical protein V9E94_20050 [Microthrixaceae bacterium]
MSLRKVFILLIGAATLAASGVYMFVYLYRWEWNRALISAAIFLAAEIAVLGWFLGRKLDSLERGVHSLGTELDVARTRRIAGHLNSAGRQPSAAFEWLRPDPGNTHVFIPVLLGAGLVLVALAWAVERVASMTASHTSDRRLASGLSRLAPPRGGFLDDNLDPLRDLRGPTGSRW